MTRRPDWETYYLGITDSVSVRADCTRRQVGAIVVKDNAIISTGYNGSPPGEPGCLSDGACPRGRHYRALYKGGSPSDGNIPLFGNVCACGLDWPCAMSVAPGSSYDTGPGACIALHAEQNALIRAGDRAQGATLYVTEKPCDGCMRLVQGAGIQTAVWYGGSWERKVPEKAPSNILRVRQWIQAKRSRLCGR